MEEIFTNDKDMAVEEASEVTAEVSEEKTVQKVEEIVSEKVEETGQAAVAGEEKSGEIQENVETEGTTEIATMPGEKAVEEQITPTPEEDKELMEDTREGIIMEMPDSYRVSKVGSDEEITGLVARIQKLIDSAIEAIKYFQYEDAVKTLKEANKEVGKISEHEDRTAMENEILSHIARIKWITGQWDKALGYCDSIIELKDITANQIPVIHAYLIKGEILGNRGHYRKAVEIFREALSMADRMGDHKEIAHCCYSLGTYYSRIGETVTGQKLLERARTIAEKYKETPGMKLILANLYNQIGLIHFRKRQLDESQKLFLSTIEMLDDEPYAHERAEALRYMGVTQSVRKENRSALDYHSKALWIHKQVSNWFGMAKVYNSIGQTCTDIGMVDNAIYFMQKAERICRDLGADAEAANIYGKLGNVFIMKEEYDKAVSFFTRDIEMSKKFGNIRALGFAYHHIGQCYIHLGKNKDAIHHLKHSQELFHKAGDTVNEKSATLTLCAAYINEGNLEEAVNIAQALGQTIPQYEHSMDNAALLMYLGVIERHMKNWADSSRYLNKAVNMLKAQGPSIKLADAYYEYGLMCLGINDNEGALSKFKEAFKIARDMGLTRQKERYFRMIERIDDLEIVKLMMEELPD